MSSRVLKILAGFGGLFLALLLWDLVRFGLTCAEFGKKAGLGFSQLDERPGPDEALVVLTGDRQRIPKALELLQARNSPVLIISGAAKGMKLTDLINAQRGTIENISPLWSKIHLETNSTSTIENAIEVKKIFSKSPAIKRLVLITSDYQMERASEIFQRFIKDQESETYAVATDSSLAGKFFYEYWKWVAYRFSFY